MKKIALLTAALFCLAAIASAIPARPGKFTYTQPDGSTIILQLHGDEWMHWTTDESGTVVELGEDGYYRPVSAASQLKMKQRSMQANAFRGELNDLRRAEYAAFTDMTHGTRHIPVILVGFQQNEFKKTNAQFENMLNLEGYSDNGAIGSVRDWYHDQSNNRFDPIFDVYGPVTLSNNTATYGNEDSDACRAIYEACQQLDGDVDFSQYDYDGDGQVDMLLMYYAGFNEAEGASTSTIWPHAYYLEYWENDDADLQAAVNNNSFDGVRVNRYFCTSELTGTSGSTMCRIGTTCHEFAHSLGLPDFYDVNYSTNGTAGGMYTYDPMCSGSYNYTSSSYESNCPANFTGLERWMLGWMDEIPEMPTGSVTLASVDQDVAYKTYASAKGEYFVYECRSGAGWDKPLQGGMIVYHVDNAKTHSISVTINNSSYTMTAYDWWQTNYFNCNSTHPCCYIIPAASQSSMNYSSATKLAFPTTSGSSTINSYTPKDWDGNTSPYSFSSITFSNQTVTMTVTKTAVTVSGKVTDQDGNAVSGAEVSVNGTVKAKTSSTGAYSFSLAGADNFYTVAVTAEGYFSASKTLITGATAITLDFTLLSYEGNLNDLQKFDATVSPLADGFEEVGASIMAAVGFSEDDLASYWGRKVKSMRFMFKGEADAVWAVVDKDDQRLVCKKIDGATGSTWIEVDLSEYDITFEQGTEEYYFGYGVDNPTVGDPIYYEEEVVRTGGGYYSDLYLDEVSWYDLGANVLVSVELEPIIGEAEYNTIDNPGKGVYSAGDTFTFALNESTVFIPASVLWYFDDEPVSGDSLVLTAGEHVVTADITLTDGTRKVVELEIVVN